MQDARIDSNSQLCGNLVSNEMSKKIRKNYFKHDATVKDIVDIKESDNRSMNIHSNSGDIYTLSNFERPDSAIAFLRNYWDMIRKEKYLKRQIRSAQFNSSSSLNQCRSQICLTSAQNVALNEVRKLLLSPKGSTTVSLTSTSGGMTASATPSETDSVYEHPSEEPVKYTPVHKRVSIKSDTVDENQSLVDSAINLDYSDKTLAGSPPSPHLKPNQTRSLSNSTTKPNPNSPCPSPPSSPTRKVLSNHNNNTNNPYEVNKHLNTPRLPDLSDWTWWPLSILPFPFGSTPQRFTMIIAYAILAFLLISTMHLYHRLALIDLQTAPVLRRAASLGLPSQFVLPDAFQSELSNLEIQLARLTELANQMVQGLGLLTQELHGLVVVAKPDPDPPLNA